MRQTHGIHHLGLTVRDIHEASAFFCNQLGFTIVGENPDYPAMFVSDGSVMLTLWQAQGNSPLQFDRRRNIGLHHFALNVADRDTLEQLYRKLMDQHGVTIEFKPEPLKGTSATHMMCIIPGGIRVEFISVN